MCAIASYANDLSHTVGPPPGASLRGEKKDTGSADVMRVTVRSACAGGTWMDMILQDLFEARQPHLLARNSNPHGHAARTLCCGIDVDRMDTL